MYLHTSIQNIQLHFLIFYALTVQCDQDSKAIAEPGLWDAQSCSQARTTDQAPLTTFDPKPAADSLVTVIPCAHARSAGQGEAAHVFGCLRNDFTVDSGFLNMFPDSSLFADYNTSCFWQTVCVLYLNPSSAYCRRLEAGLIDKKPVSGFLPFRSILRCVIVDSEWLFPFVPWKALNMWFNFSIVCLCYILPLPAGNFHPVLFMVK